MALYTSDSRDRVRDAVDFVELVSARTDLRRAGPARYEGLCPFHDERTPSFGIDPTQKVYYCFGCQASGDVFTFVQETEGVDFKGSLELLAERYGVELEREEEDTGEAERRKRRERLLELLDRTTRYYERYLWESKEARRAREYLQERGLEEAVLREFRVGYAPSAWDRVQLASRQGGYSNHDIYDVGLAQRSRQNGMLYDRFRSRIMFPLADIRGRVLGFGARAMGEEQRPKYLNTADNDVYHKGLHLYGANLARAHAARAGEVILCEGYTDTIALHQADMRNAVGLMGTALTGEQVGELARMAQTVLLALDADSAGQEAMLRASTLAERRKLELRVVPLPEGMDPAELLQHGGRKAMEAAVAQSVPFVRFRVERTLDGGDRSSPEGRDRIIGELRPVFATLAPSAMRMELMRIVSGRLELSESVAEQMLSRGGPGERGGRTASGSNGAGGRVPGLPRREEAERAFLALCIAAPQEGAQALASLDVDEHFDSELLRRAARRLREGSLDEPLADATGGGGRLDEDPELARLLAELVVEAGRGEAHPAMLEVQRLQLELARVDRQIQRARGQGRGDVVALAESRAELKREFDTAYGRALEETGEREG
ncbi:MAG TPA: DNA primase [Solirubrobacteraceae bacterium]|nr:DNA primase [Solirubrobacteraceae bacterium]